MKRIIARASCLLAVGLASPARAQHYHVNAGALATTQDAPLYFQNGGSFVTNSGFVQPLTLATNGTYAGHYFTSAFSFTAIGTGFFTPPAPGAQLRLRFVSIAGPSDGSFGIWDMANLFNDDDQLFATTLTFSVPVGATNGTNFIQLSQNNGEPNADPFGHVHGRVYSATQPGLYAVAVQIYDASTNGTGGGSIHTPSEIYSIYFQAGVTIAWLVRNEDEIAVTFATALNRSYYLESTSDLSSTNNWQAIAGPLAGNNHLQSATDRNVTANQRFYRLRVTAP